MAELGESTSQDNKSVKKPLPFLARARRVVDEYRRARKYQGEVGEIFFQKELYGAHYQRHWYTAPFDYFFNYGKSELDPSYILSILSPFASKLKQANSSPTVLDLGAGQGGAGKYLETLGIHTVNVDISRKILAEAENGVIATAWRLPFSDDAFDAVHSKDMLTHIPTQLREHLFMELKRVLKPGGRGLISSAERRMEGDYQYPTNRNEVFDIAQKSGLIPENTRSWRPKLMRKDWYFTKDKRFALEFRKPK